MATAMPSAPTHRRDELEALIGKKVGRYSITRHLASGGMAELYIAKQEAVGGFQRELVLKMLQERYAQNERVVRMFLDEARLAAKLNHQNIVHMYDVGEADGIKYIAMEYIHGPTVTEIVRKSIAVGRFLPLEHAVFIMSEVAAALAYAHDSRDSEGQPNNIVHRDVSPSNLLVSFEGVTKIVDFGIAKVQDQIREESGMRPGKVSYMAPEQLRGEAVDGRSDIFAMGVILYEITVGRRLWKGAPDQVARRILEEKIPPPTYLRRDYPPGLELIVLRALEKRPDDRYQSAEEMHRELQAFLDEEGLKTGTRRVADYLKDLFSASEGGRVVTPRTRTASGPLEEGQGLPEAEEEELDFDRRAPLTVRLEPRSAEPVSPGRPRAPTGSTATISTPGLTGGPMSATVSASSAPASAAATSALAHSPAGSPNEPGVSKGTTSGSALGLWIAFGVFLLGAVALMVFLGGR
jgi:serine/threonine protein kinase